MAFIDDSQTLLNHLFKNNVDFVGKQISEIIDFLFPDNTDNSDTVIDSDNIPLIYTGQIDIGLGVQKINNQWQSCDAIYNVYFDVNSEANALTLLGKSATTSDIAWERMGGDAGTWFLKGLAANVDTQIHAGGGLPISLFDSNNNYVIYNYGNSGREKNANVSITFNNTDGTQSVSLETANCALNFLGNGKNFVVTDTTTATNIYNNYVTNNSTYYNDYYNSYTYNFNGGASDGGGTIFVGGGAGGIAVGLAGGVCFNDIEFAINSLIDDLNLNFQNSDNDIPFQFPSYADLNYIDYGDFYIEPLHQYDNLPAVPTFDGSVDFGDIPKVIGESANAYLDLLGAGVSTILCGCFITALIVRKMGR